MFYVFSMGHGLANVWDHSLMVIIDDMEDFRRTSVNPAVNPPYVQAPMWCSGLWHSVALFNG